MRRLRVCSMSACGSKQSQQQSTWKQHHRRMKRITLVASRTSFSICRTAKKVTHTTFVSLSCSELDMCEAYERDSKLTTSIPISVRSSACPCLWTSTKVALAMSAVCSASCDRNSAEG